MSSLYIIDNNGEVLSSGGDDLHAAEVCSNEVQALNRVERAGSGILFLHYNVLEKKTPEFISLLRKVNPELNIVVVGHDLQIEVIISCVLAGANGYHDIDTLGHYISKLISSVKNGEAWVSRRVVAKLIALWRAELKT